MSAAAAWIGERVVDTSREARRRQAACKGDRNRYDEPRPELKVLETTRALLPVRLASCGSVRRWEILESR